MARGVKRFDHHEIHQLLCERHLSKLYRSSAAQADGFIERQALFCPYYVVLEGVLGMDWGVIVNPESERFGLLTFEHDFCGCPPHPEGQQTVDEWLDKKLTLANRKRLIKALRDGELKSIRPS